MENMTLTEKSAYIKGLMQGMDFKAESDEAKIIVALLDLVSDMSEKVSIMDDEIGDLFDEVDAMSEDLGDVESYLWQNDEEEDEDMFEDELYEIKCPACGEVICLDEGRLASEDLACPNCATKFEVDFSDECSFCNEPSCDED